SMFARRHPYLFTLIVLAGLACLGLVAISLTAFAVSDSERLVFGPRVGLIEISGVISDSTFVVNSLERFAESPDIKAVLLRVDSPGGSIGPSQEIFSQVQKTAAKKPVVASLGSMAASGGYYVSAPATGIMANPGTITGSIGVILSYTNIEGLFDKVGLKPIVIKSGRYKDMGSPFRDITETERELFEEAVMDLYRQFVGDVALGRQMEIAAVEELADGRIFTGSQALELGLVDKIGNLRDALEWAAELGGIEGPIAVQPARKKGFSLLEELIALSSEMTRSLHQRTATGFAFLWNMD
ncbi:MAG: signal peptide peptidase SppA, partial [Desulfatibacillaceae bacterium]|nr:signal peptide peptidase SppA [Desulfatibacillaceae bacterium]